MLKNSLISIFIVLTFSNIIFSQVRPSFALGVQALGNTPYLGLKIQRDFLLKSNSHLTVSLGIGATNISSPSTSQWRSNEFSFGQEITYSTGRHKNFLEMGISGEYLNREDGFVVGRKYNIHPLIGYKHISKNGFVGRIHFTPITIINDLGVFIQLYGGISLGLYFSKNKNI